MTDTATKTAIPALDTVPVKRNEIELPFINTIIKRGPAESRGKQYLAPDVNKDNLLTVVIPWIGLEESASIIANLLKKKSKGWFDENSEDDGSFNAVGFADMASTYSARGESIPDLLAEIEDISSQQQDILNSAEFGTGNTIETVKGMAQKIIGLRTAIENKRRLTKEEKAAAEAAKVAGETKA